MSHLSQKSPQEIYDRVESIPGWFSLEDIQGFSELSLPAKPLIMECGTYCGRSANVFSMLWPDAEILTCDPVDESQRQLPINAKFYNRKGVDMPNVGMIDLLFIDDSHYYDDIKANFEKFMPLVKSGGFVIFHDYYFQTDDVEGVRRFVNELGSCTFNGGEYGLAIWRKE